MVLQHDRPTLSTRIDAVTGGRRLRRLRQHDWSRRLVRETELSPADLIWPIFVREGAGADEAVPSMPGVARRSVARAVEAAREARDLGIPVVALFPFTTRDRRDDRGSEALNENNLVCRASRAIKDAVPEVGILCDVALDPYTSHGHDGVMRGGRIDNDESVEILCRQALVQARSGCDIIGPSDMMDGRVAMIRETLDAEGLRDTMIMSYAAKYASAFYGPFRDAVGSNDLLKGDKRTYQMDFGNAEEAVREAAQDIAEGADMIMVKPGMVYLDIVARLAAEFGMPTFAYQTSGEYAMIEAAAGNGWLDGERAMMESLAAFKRAGAAGILSYFAPRAAAALRRG
ncbi:delta-aminolevulinic acid dehydratase [Aureimonas endophytica]|uniref:Delta-aminolevulinic acid dehydratase n=1 Tax=Aureimonas endophytica TaxID=2027858 RepID=A0A916ZBF4_9HYPH|nr:porphobilinogen synthase [Aureimonas endophytica]GGD85973.1 delta-aminolevulinic acid dehydratase [Aureimonas endophytica]